MLKSFFATAGCPSGMCGCSSSTVAPSLSAVPSTSMMYDIVTFFFFVEDVVVLIHQGGESTRWAGKWWPGGVRKDLIVSPCLSGYCSVTTMGTSRMAAARIMVELTYTQ